MPSGARAIELSVAPRHVCYRALSASGQRKRAAVQFRSPATDGKFLVGYLTGTSIDRPLLLTNLPDPKATDEVGVRRSLADIATKVSPLDLGLAVEFGLSRFQDTKDGRTEADRVAKEVFGKLAQARPLAQMYYAQMRKALADGRLAGGPQTALLSAAKEAAKVREIHRELRAQYVPEFATQVYQVQPKTAGRLLVQVGGGQATPIPKKSAWRVHFAGGPRQVRLVFQSGGVQVDREIDLFGIEVRQPTAAEMQGVVTRDPSPGGATFRGRTVDQMEVRALRQFVQIRRGRQTLMNRQRNPVRVYRVRDASWPGIWLPARITVNSPTASHRGIDKLEIEIAREVARGLPDDATMTAEEVNLRIELDPRWISNVQAYWGWSDKITRDNTAAIRRELDQLLERKRRAGR